MSSDDGGVGTLSSNSGAGLRLRSSDRATGRVVACGGAFRFARGGVLGAPFAFAEPLLAFGDGRVARLALDDEADCFAVFARVAAARRPFAPREEVARADFFEFDRELDRRPVVLRVAFFDDPRLAPARAGRFPAFFAISV
jgi:hypothetical protein